MLVSRNGLSYAHALPEIIAALRRFPFVAVLDYELVVVDGQGRPQWERLRRRARIYRRGAPEAAAASEPASLYAFDLLATDGHDARELPLVERKVRLAQVLDGTRRVRYVEHLEAHGEALFAKVCELDFEGVVAKRADSIYRARRRPEWVKAKNPNYSRQVASRFGYE